MRRHICTAAAVVIIAAALLTDKYFCPFKAAFKIPCPGCGTIRAIAALSKGDSKGALGYNLIVFALPIFYALYLLCRRFVKKPLAEAIVITAAAVFTLLNWIRLIALGV